MAIESNFFEIDNFVNVKYLKKFKDGVEFRKLIKMLQNFEDELKFKLKTLKKVNGTNQSKLPDK